MKFKYKFTKHNYDKPYIAVIGQNPGRQRKDAQTGVVWEGNRSGDFISIITRQFDNIYLTNVTNYQDINDATLHEGLQDLRLVFDTVRPKRVICLGLFAAEHVKKLKNLLAYDFELVVMHHPSFVLRFNKSILAYARKLKDYLS